MGRCSYKKQSCLALPAPFTSDQEMHAGISFLIKANLTPKKKKRKTNKKFEIRLPELKQCILKCFAMAVVFVGCFFVCFNIVYTMLSTLATPKRRGNHQTE